MGWSVRVAVSPLAEKLSCPAFGFESFQRNLSIDCKLGRWSSPPNVPPTIVKSGACSTPSTAVHRLIRLVFLPSLIIEIRYCSAPSKHEKQLPE